MSLLRVYLDQNAWVRLSRQHYKREHDDRVAGVLALVLEASRTGRVSFPLSASHYEETWRRGDPGSRQRLGAFMAKVSRFHTIAGPVNLLETEVDGALRRLAGQAPGPGPVVFGRGAAHAFSQPTLARTHHDDLRAAVAAFGEEPLFEYFETALLAGPPDRLPARGTARPTHKYGQRQLDFETETGRRLQEAGHTRDRAHRLVLEQESHDVIEPVNRMASGLGLAPVDVFAGRDALTDFMLSLPAKGAVCRMRMTGHENPRFRWQVGDLDDITALGTAAAYCDVVVAENHWGSILQRHAVALRARVVTDVHDLPALLM